jgi:hypothetical protein
VSEELKRKLLELAQKWAKHEEPGSAFSEHESGFLSGYEAAKRAAGEELLELLGE